ncbi:SymE family type I addiction module toxin [Niabella sp. 22666]|uniref:SymE family type I addiction module toxin n=1 Tax=Niabella sp. 22666 TaxID=3453954 RepID=UPI003F8547F6
MTTQQKHRSVTRRMGICSPSYIPFKSRRQPHPVIRLAGSWLQESGFGIGQVVEITCEPGRLTITPAPAQHPAEVEALLQQHHIQIV